MKERQYVEERKTFCREDKEFVLMKSGGRCSHCGKKLTLDNDFTIEHIIPLSKGGTNQHANIVALCDSCNKNKANNIVFPIVYYKYLCDEYMDDVLNMYAEYKDEFSYFNSKNLLFTDIIPTVAPHIMKGHKGSKNTCVTVIGDIKKAKYYDLDKIYNAYRSYLRKHGLKTDGVKHFLSEIFKLGCIYFQTNKAGDITLVLPFIALVDKYDQKHLTLTYPICVYDKIKYYSMYQDLMDRLIATIYVEVGLDFCEIEGYFLKDSNSAKLQLYFEVADSVAAYHTEDKGDYVHCGLLQYEDKLKSEVVLSYYNAINELFTTYMRSEDLKLI